LSVRRLIALLAAAALPAFGAPAAHAQQQPTEEAVKAAFLPKFARYVEWPQLAQPVQGAPFQLCVIGRNPFGRMIDAAAAGEQIDSHGVAVRHFASADGAGGCHIAFVTGATPAETSRMLAALGRQPVLTVTDARAGQAHGMIHFVMIGARVRFFIDEAAASERGLSISSRLLALAAQVRQRR
jgi:hypothetical protein